MAQWRTQYDCSGFPVEQAKLCGFDLSVAYIGGEWQWLVRRDGRDFAEGAARCAAVAKEQAANAAWRLLDVVTRTARTARAA